MVSADLGRTIHTLRTARGWTQRQLAARAGVSDMTISKLERHVSHGRRRSLAGIARAFGVSLEALLTSAPVPALLAEDPLTRQLLTLWRDLLPEHRQAGLEALTQVVWWSGEYRRLIAAVRDRRRGQRRPRSGGDAADALETAGAARAGRPRSGRQPSER